MEQIIIMSTSCEREGERGERGGDRGQRERVESKPEMKTK